MTLRHVTGIRATTRLWRLNAMLLGLLLVSFALLGCAAIGEGLADGAGKSLGPRVPTLTHDAVAGARDALAESETEKALLKLEKAMVDSAREGAIGPETQAKLQQLLDASFVTLRTNAVQTRESLLGEGLSKDVARLRDEALGAKTSAQIHDLKDEILGEDTNTRMKALVDSALSNESLDRIRERLVGAPLDKSVNELLKHASVTLKSELPNVLDPVLKALGTAENRVFGLLVLLVVIVGAVVTLVAVALFYFRKHRRIIRVITRRVEDHANNEALKVSIKKAADDAGVEDYLHMLLKKNDIPVKDLPQKKAA
jgi:hypothetical protein